MHDLWQDFHYALRTLRKNPGFTAITVLILALAIGGNSAIFSVVDGILLKPLPYPQPDRLVRIFGVWPKWNDFPMSPADFLDFRVRNQVFSKIALYFRQDLDLTIGDKPENLKAMAVSSGFFETLGFAPLLGRTFQSGDELEGAGKSVILSYGFWQRRMGGDPNIIGRTLTLSGAPYQVLGVMPPGIQHVGGDYHSLPHGENVELWWPMPLTRENAARRSLLKCDRAPAAGRHARKSRSRHERHRRAVGQAIPGHEHRPAYQAGYVERGNCGARASHADGAAGSGWMCAVDRLRQRGQPVAGPRHWTPARNCEIGR